MARVSRRLVVIEDTLFTDECVEAAEKLRDPTHVRAYGEAEWRAFIAAAGLEIINSAFCEKLHPMDEWLALTGCTGDRADRVRGLLMHRSNGSGAWTDTKALFKCRKRDTE